MNEGLLKSPFNYEITFLTSRGNEPPTILKASQKISISLRENHGSNKLVSKTNTNLVLVEQFQLFLIKKTSHTKDATQGLEISQPHEPITTIDHDQVPGRGSRTGIWTKICRSASQQDYALKVVVGSKRSGSMVEGQTVLPNKRRMVSQIGKAN